MALLQLTTRRLALCPTQQLVTDHSTWHRADCSRRLALLRTSQLIIGPAVWPCCSIDSSPSGLVSYAQLVTDHATWHPAILLTPSGLALHSQLIIGLVVWLLLQYWSRRLVRVLLRRHLAILFTPSGLAPHSHLIIILAVWRCFYQLNTAHATWHLGILSRHLALLRTSLLIGPAAW